MKLQFKMMILLIPMLAITVLANNLLMSSVLENEHVESLKNEVFIVGNGARMEVDKLLKSGIMFKDIIAFPKICNDAMQKYPDISEIFVINSDKKMLYHTDGLKSSIANDINELGISMKVRADNAINYNENGKEYLACMIQIFDKQNGFDDLLVGAIVLTVPKDVIKKKARLYDTYPIRLAACCFLFLLLVIFLAISVWITKPITKLDRAAKAINQKGVEKFKKIETSSKDEIGDLTDSFNNMAYELQKTMVSKTYLDNIISSITDAIIVTGPDCRIQSFNEAAKGIFGYNSEELLNKNIGSMLTEPIEDVFEGEKFAERIKNGEFKNFETMFKNRNKASIPVILSCSVILDNDGGLKHIVCSIKDITVLKTAQESLKSQKEMLERSNAELQEFAYVASHDLQEPLRKIMAFGDRLKDKCKDALSDQGIDYLERMQNASRRMQVLINDLLKYSRINTRAQPFEEVDLRKVVNEVLNDLEIRIEQTNAKITVEELPVIDAEPTHMRQLFQNIISNSLKFYKEDTIPEIKIFSREINEHKSIYYWEFTTIEFCEIIFEDNGIGIEEKYFERIFGVFQRLHGRDAYEGTGVGLAICQKIVERHGGSIRVESVFGEGSRFIIKLPLRQIGKEDLC